MDKMKMSLKGGAEDVGGVQCSPANDSQQVKLLFIILLNPYILAILWYIICVYRFTILFEC